jgi:hypothetical protein
MLSIAPARLALVVALRERVEHVTARPPVLDEPEPNAATVTQGVFSRRYVGDQTEASKSEASIWARSLRPVAARRTVASATEPRSKPPGLLTRCLPGCLQQNREIPEVPDFIGAPDTIRTCDLCLRRATLYPAELRVRGVHLAD